MFGQRESVLEVLYRAADNLQDPSKPYEFTNWNACTCGHIYAAALDKEIRCNGSISEILSTRHIKSSKRRLFMRRPKVNLYVTVMQKLVEAHGGAEYVGQNAYQFISDLTSKNATYGKTTRKAALEIVQKAIRYLEATDARELALYLEVIEKEKEAKRELAKV